MSGERTYRLEPLDASGVFLGLGLVQCVLVGGGITVAVVAISAGLPLIGAVLPVACGAALSFARVGGRPAWEWLPLGGGWVVRHLLWGERWFAPLPLWPTQDDEAPPLPPCLAGLSLHNVAWHDGVWLGCVRDIEWHTLTAVVPVSAPRFVVESTGEQERLLAAWGDVLGQFAGDRGPVSHVGWSDLVRPSSLEQHVEWLGSLNRAVAHPDATDSYTELVEVAGANSTVHDVVVTVTVSRDRLRRRPDLADSDGGRGGDGMETLQRALGSAVDALLRGLLSAGMGASDPLDAHGLQKLLRSRIDLSAGVGGCTTGRLAQRLGLVPQAASGPLVVDTGWRHLRVDASWQRTFWVASWPRLAVPPCWLEPFIAADVTRAMTVVLVPVSTHQSRRRIERDLVKLESDAATKEQQGRRVDARHRRATDTLLEREQELIAGFPEMAYVGLVTVSASTEGQLEDHSEVVEQLARETGLELRVLDGRQDVAWAAALPFGLAPKTLLGS
jgi:hypothetical protein